MIPRIDIEIRFSMKMCYCFTGNADRRDKFYCPIQSDISICGEEYRSLIRKINLFFVLSDQFMTYFPRWRA